MTKPTDPRLELIGLGNQSSVQSPEKQASIDVLAEIETQAYAISASDADDVFEKKLRIGFHLRELRQIDEMLSARRDFAKRIFWMLVGWLAITAIVIIASGLNRLQLDTRVLLALVGSTTLNVIGIFAVVAKFIFPNKGHELPRWSKGGGKIKNMNKKNILPKESANSNTRAAAKKIPARKSTRQISGASEG